MRRQGLILILLIAAPSGMRAGEGVIGTTICDVVRSPGVFKGKMIRVRGSIAPNVVDAPLYAHCNHGRGGSMVLYYPEKLPLGKRPFELVRDADFEKFKYYLRAEPLVKPELPPGWGSDFFPRRYCSIIATITGRFNAVSEEAVLRGRGFGEAGWSQFRLVVKAVANPVAEECPPQPKPQPPPPLPPPPELLTQPPPPPAA